MGYIEEPQIHRESGRSNDFAADAMFAQLSKSLPHRKRRAKHKRSVRRGALRRAGRNEIREGNARTPWPRSL